eukprot:1771831-Alexandrium_andersonii.AAC.1
MSPPLASRHRDSLMTDEPRLARRHHTHLMRCTSLQTEIEQPHPGVHYGSAQMGYECGGVALS